MLWMSRKTRILIYEEILAMTVLANAVSRLTVSADALTAAVNALPPPVDESAVADAINAQTDKVDAATAKLTTPAP